MQLQTACVLSVSCSAMCSQIAFQSLNAVKGTVSEIHMLCNRSANCVHVGVHLHGETDPKWIRIRPKLSLAPVISQLIHLNQFNSLISSDYNLHSLFKTPHPNIMFLKAI